MNTGDPQDGKYYIKETGGHGNPLNNRVALAAVRVHSPKQLEINSRQYAGDASKGNTWKVHV